MTRLIFDTQQAFDSVAADYDGPLGNNELIQRMRKSVWKLLADNFPPGSRLLDLGCGTGLDAAHLAGQVAAERSQGWMRGALLALPVVVVFGLLLANADPVFATLRRSLEEVLSRWDFLPRLVFFGVLFVASLGAGGLALRGSSASSPVSTPSSCACLGRTERLVVLGAVAGLFAVFLLLQLTYLFGNAPAVAGSGIEVLALEPGETTE